MTTEVKYWKYEQYSTTSKSFYMYDARSSGQCKGTPYVNST